MAILRSLRALLSRLAGLFGKARRDREFADELEAHFQEHIADKIRAGMTPDEARRDAVLTLGGIDATKERYRDRRGLPALETFAQDLRYGLRGLKRNPLITFTALVTLALTIGAVSTVLTLVRTYFFQQLPVDHPERLVEVLATRRNSNDVWPVSYRDFVHFRDGVHTLNGLAAHYSSAPLFVTIQDNAREINGAVVTANYFTLLNLKPALGRFFLPEEDSVPDRDAVAVLSYQLWQTGFGSSENAVGASIKVNGVPFTVVGVAPSTFRGIVANPSEIYIPTMMLRVGYRFCRDPLADNCTILGMLGRLADGHGLEEAAAELSTLLPPAWAQAREGDNARIAVSPQHVAHRSDTEAWFIGLVAFAAGVLLLACCANLAAVLIARGSTRAHELAIRTALGASGARLVRQLLTESLSLAVLGGVLGIVLSGGMTRGLSVMFYSSDAEGHPLYYDFSLQPVVILLVLGVSVLAGVLFSLMPAANAIRLGAVESLKKLSPAVGTHGIPGRWLVAVQAAIAVVLITLAALFSASARMVVNGERFEASHVALLRLRPRLARYSPQKAQQFQREAIRRLEAIPEVESVSMISPGAVLFGGEARVSLPDSPASTQPVGYGEIGPRYFETLRVAVLRGREFDDGDSVAAAPVAVVSEALARRVWPTGDVIGSTLVVANQARTIVGIVEDLSLQRRTEAITPYVYVPFWQNPGQVDARLCIRVRGDPEAMLPALVREVNRADPDVPVAEAITLPFQMAGTVKPLRLSATVIGYGAALTAVLSAVGLYASLAFAVSRRTREIGIRMAIGAEPRRVRHDILREGMTVILSGVIAGVLGTVASATVVQRFLYGTDLYDATIFASSAALVTGGGLLACWVPARRAARLEPMVALRHE